MKLSSYAISELYCIYYQIISERNMPSCNLDNYKIISRYSKCFVKNLVCKYKQMQGRRYEWCSNINKILTTHNDSLLLDSVTKEDIIKKEIFELIKLEHKLIESFEYFSESKNEIGFPKRISKRQINGIISTHLNANDQIRVWTINIRNFITRISDKFNKE